MFPMGGSGNAMALALPGLPIGSTPSAPGSAKGKGELDRNDNIKVVVRVRPMLPHELESPPVLQVTDGSTVKVRTTRDAWIRKLDVGLVAASIVFPILRVLGCGTR